MTLGDLEKTLGNKVRKENEEQRESGLTLAMVWKSGYKTCTCPIDREREK